MVDPVLVIHLDLLPDLYVVAWLPVSYLPRIACCPHVRAYGTYVLCHRHVRHRVSASYLELARRLPLVEELQRVLQVLVAVVEVPAVPASFPHPQVLPPNLHHCLGHVDGRTTV